MSMRVLFCCVFSLGFIGCTDSDSVQKVNEITEQAKNVMSPDPYKQYKQEVYKLLAGNLPAHGVCPNEEGYTKTGYYSGELHYADCQFEEVFDLAEETTINKMNKFEGSGRVYLKCNAIRGESGKWREPSIPVIAFISYEIYDKQLQVVAKTNDSNHVDCK